VAWLLVDEPEEVEEVEEVEELAALEGAVPELKPLLVFVPVLVPVPVLVLVLVVALLSVAAWADPGNARAITPAVATLIALTAAVAERTRAWPRALAATARPILSRFMRTSSVPVVEAPCATALSYLCLCGESGD
jgi:hypothetical protein